MLPEKYELLDTIGRGGQGTVYKVINKEDNTIYALKVINISEQSNKKARKQIKSEVNSLKKLKHPNVVRMYSVQETKHELYLQMDYIDGIKLTKAVNESTFSYNSSIKTMMKLLSAMSHVHKKKVAHLDIKPDNILLRKDNMPIIIDFGCSFTLDTVKKNYKKKDDQLLTAGYVAPEVLMNKSDKFNPKLADIYSLGATFYTMLTQQTVYNAVDQHRHVMALGNGEEIKPPHTVCTSIPKEISEICIKSIEPNPHERFQSCKEFYDELNSVLNNKKITKQKYFFSSSSKTKKPLFKKLLITGCIIPITLGSYFYIAAYLGKKPYIFQNCFNTAQKHEQGLTSNEPDYKKSLQYYIKAANSGNTDALIKIGDLYFKGGYGLEKNYDQALFWYLKATKYNNPDALYQAGYFYQHGYGVSEQNYQIALEYYKKAHKFGNKQASINIGNLYVEGGYGINANYYEAEKWLTIEAIAENVMCMKQLGYIYEHGKDEFESNPKKAIEWYKKVLKQKPDDHVMVNIACIYERSPQLFSENSYKKALEWYKKSEAHGYHDFFLHLGNLYYNAQNGFPEDHIQALYWYKKAAEKGNSQAMIKTADFYYNGDTVKKNYSKALYWLKKANNQNSVNINEKIATIYHKGEYGIDKDYREAIKYYKQAHQEGYNPAKYHIANIYTEGGHGVTTNYKEAAKIYKEIIGNEKTALSAHVAKELSKIYYAGGYGVEKDNNEFEKWCVHSNLDDHPEIMYNIANLYFRENKYIIKQNKKRALYWYTKFLEFYEQNAHRYVSVSELIARNNLGTIHYEGDREFKPDWQKGGKSILKMHVQTNWIKAVDQYTVWYENKHKFRTRALTEQQMADCMKASLNHITIYYMGGYGIDKNHNTARILSKEYYQTLKIFGLNKSQKKIFQQIKNIYDELK